MLQKVISKKVEKTYFCRHLKSHWRKEQDRDPDPLVIDKDSRIRIHTKMSWIHDNALKNVRMQVLIETKAVKVTINLNKYTDT